MAESGFDDLIHAPLRLRICSLLSAADALAFGVLRDTLGISDAHLSKQVKVLADAGYVSSAKTAEPHRDDARKTTWVSLTKAGRAAYDGHVAELRRMLAQDG